jgi:hypothetical protein
MRSSAAEAVHRWRTAFACILGWLLIAAPAQPQTPKKTSACAAVSAAKDPHVRRALEAARLNRLGEYVVAIDRAIALEIAACDYPADLVYTSRGFHALVLSRIGGNGEADQIAADILPLQPRAEPALAVRQRLLITRMDLAAERADAAGLAAALRGFEQDPLAMPKSAGQLGEAAFYRRCLETGNIRFKCRDRETTILYGQYAVVSDGRPRVVQGQCDPEPLLNTYSLGPSGPMRFASASGEALLKACELERDIAKDAAAWSAAVDDLRPDGDPGPLLREGEALRGRILELGGLIDRFDQNAISRFQPLALGLFIEVVHARVRLARGETGGLAAVARTARTLRPLADAAFAEAVQGKTGFLQADTISLLGLANLFDVERPEAERADRHWRLLHLSFGPAAPSPNLSFNQLRASLGEDETAVVLLTGVDSIGAVMSARRSGPIVFGEFDPGARLLADVGTQLLSTFGRPPAELLPEDRDAAKRQAEDAAVPTGAARAIYTRILCPAERRLGRTSRLAFVLDPVSERFPLTLMLRPRTGCARDLTPDELDETARRTSLAGELWLGVERAFRIVPLVAQRAPGARPLPGYLGIAPASTSRAGTRAVEERSAEALEDLNPLPGAMAEVRQAAATLQRKPSQTLLRRRASEREVVSALGERSYGIVHFASHAVDLLLDRNMPAIVLANPQAASSKTATDDLMTPDEIGRLQLPGSLVLLSACRTAMPRPGFGRGLVSGLAAAFVRAGATEVMVTYWRIPDNTTTPVMGRVFQGLREGRTLTAAVGEAHQAAGKGAFGPSVMDPYSWAASVAVVP